MAKFVLVVHVVAVDADYLFLALHESGSLHVDLEHAGLVESLVGTKVEDLDERDHALLVLCACGLPKCLAYCLGEELLDVQRRIILMIVLESHTFLGDALFHLFELLIGQLNDLVLAVNLALHKHRCLEHFFRALLHDAFLLRWLQRRCVSKNLCNRSVAKFNVNALVFREDLFFFYVGQDDTFRLIVEDRYELLLLLPDVFVFQQKLSFLNH